MWRKGLTKPVQFKRHKVLDLVMQRKRDTNAALKRHRRLLRNQPVEPTRIETDGLGSYVSALRILDLQDLHAPGRLRENNRAENSRLAIRRREREMSCRTGWR